METTRHDDKMAALFGMGETVEVESVEETITPIVGVKSGKSAFGKLSKNAPVKQKVADNKTVETEKQGLDAFSLEDILAHVGMTMADYGKVQKSKKRGSRGSYSTVGDAEIIKFLALAKYSTDSIIGYSQGIKDYSMKRRLDRLIKKGLVKRTKGDNAKVLYALTPEGMRTSGYNLDTMGDTVNGQNVQPTLGASWAMAEHWQMGHRDFVSTQQINSALGKELKSGDGSFKGVAIRSMALWSGWNKTDPDNSPEKTNLSLYAIPYYSKLDGTHSHHVPDLVVVYPRVKADEKGNPVLNENGDGIAAVEGDNSVPWSTAIEIERTHHTVDKYTEVMKCYKNDRNVFKEVVWFAATDGIAKKIEAGCKAAHMPEDRYTIELFKKKNEDGEHVDFKGADFTKM